MCSATVSRRGLSRALLSRPFSLADLEEAARDHSQQTVFMDEDAEGYLCSAGGGVALAAVRARAAPHVAACDAVLTRAGPHVAACDAVLTRTGPHVAACDAALGRAGPHDSGALRLQLVRAVPPLHELRLWFDDDLLAALDMPFLTLRNIRGRKDYECHECGARFEEPNPLKTHLFLRCAPFAVARFWRQVVARLSPAPAPPPPGLASAFHRVPPLVAAPSPPASPGQTAAERLEALATEWGRSRGGHACLYCGKLYSRKYGLKIHIRTHTGYRPLRCSHCGRAFGDPSNLNKHLRLHAAAPASPAPHACSRCGKCLARRRDLLRHQRAHCAASPSPSLSPSLSP